MVSSGYATNCPVRAAAAPNVTAWLTPTSLPVLALHWRCETAAEDGHHTAARQEVRGTGAAEEAS